MNDDSSLAMCWYDATEWQRLKALDPASLDDSYETWHRNATRAVHELALAGHTIRKVAIKVDALLRWCAEHGVENNAESRAAYAAWKLQQRLR
jgi:hypothetical protein